MRTAYWAWVPASLAAAFLIGCGQPTLTVRHRLPPDLPQAAGIAAVRPGRVQVTPSLEGPFEEVLTEMLAKRLSGDALAAAPGHSPVEAVIDATCDIRTDANQNTRRIRRWHLESRDIVLQPAPSLVRTTKVRVDFLLRDAHTGRTLAAVETHESHDSDSDPRSTGALGLGRPDDPALVPDTHTVVRELLAACVDTLARMIQPAELERTLPLRGALVGGADRANRAAAAGKLTEAAERLRTCLQSHPRHGDLWFNLGAIEEAAGRLEQAEEAYRETSKLRKGRDAPAAEGLRRVRRILRLRQWSREATARAAGP
jgi:hypothetical protein